MNLGTLPGFAGDFTSRQAFYAWYYDKPGTYWLRKPDNCAMFFVAIRGGGGGGGAGAVSTNSVSRSGGAGGGAGGGGQIWIPALWLPDQIRIVVGAGGAGANSQSSDNSNGGNGTAGGNSVFHELLATGGGGGGGGTNTTSVAGYRGRGPVSNGGNVGISPNISDVSWVDGGLGGACTAGANATDAPNWRGCTGGGAGGGMSSGTSRTGSNAGGPILASSNLAGFYENYGHQGSGGGLGINGGDARDMFGLATGISPDGGYPIWGFPYAHGGGGGGGLSSGNVGRGGNGGWPGGGGGGGGCTLNASGGSGAGGKGGGGFVVVMGVCAH